MASIEPVNAVQATPVQVMTPRKKRRDLAAGGALAGAGLGAAGLGGTAAAGAGGVAVILGSDMTARFTPGRLGYGKRGGRSAHRKRFSARQGDVNDFLGTTMAVGGREGKGSANCRRVWFRAGFPGDSGEPFPKVATCARTVLRIGNEGGWHVLSLRRAWGRNFQHALRRLRACH